MSNSYPLAMRPEAQLAMLDKKSRKELERAFQEMLVQRGSTYLAQQAVGTIHLAALESVSQTLSTAEFIKAMHGSAALPGFAEMDTLLRQQYLATVGQLTAIADQKIINWLMEE